MFGKIEKKMWRSTGKRLISLIALAAIIFAFLGSAPILHERLHQDHGDPKHFCILTSFQSGHLIASFAAQLVTIISLVLLSSLCVFSSLTPSIDVLGYQSPRAPPLVICSADR